MRIYNVFPRLTRTRQMSLWHKALKQQWSATDLDWKAPGAPRGDGFKDHLGRVLTPVITGEQSALYSVATLIPILGGNSEVEGQFYLGTWVVDEARHTELFVRYYERLGREPMSIRKFPYGYLFQSQIGSTEPAVWLAGTLVSEVLAKLVMEEFRRLDLDPVLNQIAEGILADEARHLAFNHIYLEERFGGLFREGERAGRDLAERLEARLEAVMAHVAPIFDHLDADLRAVGLDRDLLYEEMRREARERLRTSIERGERAAAGVPAAGMATEGVPLGGASTASGSSASQD